MDKTEIKRGRGRPSSPLAMTGAERAKRFRDKHKNDPKPRSAESLLIMANALQAKKIKQQAKEITSLQKEVAKLNDSIRFLRLKPVDMCNDHAIDDDVSYVQFTESR